MTIREKLYSTKEAAEYLGVKPATVRWHLYVTKRLEADIRLGHVLGFYQSTLDDFRARKGTPGRQTGKDSQP